MADKQISLLWTKGLTPEDASKLQEQINAQYHLFERLQEIIDDRISEVRTERISKVTFESPAWSEYQAHLNGKELALTELKILLKLRD